MSKLQPVRGTHDLYGESMARHRLVEEAGRRIFSRYNFEEIALPIFEFTEVFARNLGESSDIVSKEMYTFADRGGENLTLRPEFTAGVVRFLISNGLAAQTPLKFCMMGPNFRYERPQKGRQRQFHQLGVEIFGAAVPDADTEVIALGYDILRDLGLVNRVRLEINTLGDMESRAAYRKSLVDYLEKHKAELSEKSIERLAKNPLRVLDSKEQEDQAIIRGAPDMKDFMNAASDTFFADVQKQLQVLGIPYEINRRLVRGMDYYCHTVFEFITEDLGAQGTVIAGGRYDGLVKAMGGPDTPAVGWGAGIERLAMLVTLPQEKANIIAFVPYDAETNLKCLELAHKLRSAGFAVDMGYSGNMGKRLKRADKAGARFAVIIGEDELKQNAASIRNLENGQQTLVQLDQIISYFEAMLS